MKVQVITLIDVPEENEELTLEVFNGFLISSLFQYANFSAPDLIDVDWKPSEEAPTITTTVEIVDVDVEEFGDYEGCYNYHLSREKTFREKVEKARFELNQANDKALADFYTHSDHCDTHGEFDPKKVGSNEPQRKDALKIWMANETKDATERLHELEMNLLYHQNNASFYQNLLDRQHRRDRSNIDHERVKLRWQELQIAKEELALKQTQQ